MKKQSAGPFRGKRHSARADAVVGKTLHGTREVWRISSGGKIRNIATSASSTAAMDEAMVIYGRALKRLANR
jgi:hypothetical protein